MRGAQANAWARYPVAARTPGYELHFVLSRADVHHIRKNNLMIAIMKKVKSNASSDSDVIWVASSAFRKVLVCWREDYAVYASATDIEAGNAVVLNSLMRADTGHSYIFEGGTFSDDGVASGDAFHVVNQSSIHHRLTLGLAQGATVNGNDVLSPTVDRTEVRHVVSEVRVITHRSRRTTDSRPVRSTQLEAVQVGVDVVRKSRLPLHVVAS